MKIAPKNIGFCSALACLLIALCPALARAQRITVSASPGGVSWQVTAPSAGISLRVSQPNGTVFERNFVSGESPTFTSPTGILPDGSYTYELRISPPVSNEARPQAKAADEVTDVSDLPSTSVQTGVFGVVGGVVKVPDTSAVESQKAPSVPEDTFGDVIIQANNTRILFDDNSVGTFPANDWEIDTNDDFDGGVSRFSINDVTGGRTPFTIRALAPTNSLFVASSSGNVGLGTGAPVQPLHISRDVNPNIRLEQTSASIPRTWEILANNSTGFRISDETAGRTGLSIRSDTGAVGLGTSAPAGQFHVLSTGNQLSIFQSSDNMAVQFRLQTNSINRRFVALNNLGQVQSQLVFGDNGAFSVLGPTVNDSRMEILGNGRVGIGTKTPNQMLSVNGNASKPGGGSWATFSDERLKNIKGEFKAGLDEIMKLQPIRYEYKADNAIGLKSEGEHIGFGAASVSKVIPEAVTRSENGYLMIDNDPILWTMLNAIKEQNAQIEDLKNQVKRLQAEVVLQADGKKSSRKSVAERGQ